MQDRAAEARRQRAALVVYLFGAVALATGFTVYFLVRPEISNVLALVNGLLVVSLLGALAVALRGRVYLAGVLSQTLPIVPVMVAASAFSVEAGFGSYLFIGALGVVVMIPASRPRAQVTLVSVLLVAIVILQVFFTRENAWNALDAAHTAQLSTFNRAVMTVVLFALALELTRSTRVGRRLADDALYVATLLATTDALTGLPTRRPLRDRLDVESPGPRTVALIDVDHFKDINDAHGHDCGDEALVHVASVLQASLRPSDLVGRWGGEEFVVVIDAPLDHARAIIDRARQAVADAPALLAGEPVSVTVSAGLASIFPGEGALALRAADRALYRAKRAGRNRVEV